MTTDGQAIQEAKASAAMVLTYFTKDIPASAPEGFNDIFCMM